MMGSEVLDRDEHSGRLSAHGDDLRLALAHVPDQFTEPVLGVLKLPTTLWHGPPRTALIPREQLIDLLIAEPKRLTRSENVKRVTS
jgi:hypothetical protein